MYREVSIYIEDSRLDLFPDETISLTRSAQSLKDLTKVFTDFTKSFKVPANDNNNAIFKHYYDANVTNGFDARGKVAGRIEIGGITFQKGQFQLNGAMLKDNVVQNYDLQFFGDTIKVKDLIGDDTLQDLDLSQYNHNYNASTIQGGLTAGIAGGDIKYPLLSYKRRFLWQDSNLSDDEQVNIKYDAAFTDGVDWQELKPAIRVGALWSKIKQTYGLDFTNDFTDRGVFNDLFMSLGNGKETTTPYATTVVESQDINIYQRPNTASTWRPKMFLDITTTSTAEYRVSFYINGALFRQFDWETGNNSFSVVNAPFFTTFGNYNFEWIIESKDIINATLDVELRQEQFDQVIGTPLEYNLYTRNGFNVSLPAPQVNINELTPKIKIVDFIAAIFKAFNLVMQPTDSGDIYLNDLNTWYSSGNIFDISEYVDISTLQVERGKLFKEINMGYEQNDSFLAQEYKANFKIDFGAIENKVAELLGIEKLIAQDDLEIQLPFSNPQFERLLGSEVQYGYIVDKDQQTFENTPFLFYCPNKALPNGGYVGFSGTNYTALTNINIPSHAQNLSGGFAFQFNAELNEYNGQLLDRNLYSVFWQDYILDVLSEQRRQFTINAYLPITLSNDLKLNDRLIIKGNRYVIDNLETNLLTGVTKLVLLNDIFTSLNVGDVSKVGQKVGVYQNSGVVPYTGAELAYVSTSADWITLTSNTVSNGENITFTLEDNSSGERAGVIEIQDNLNNPTIIVIQE
jgi:hypothetical protein